MSKSNDSPNDASEGAKTSETDPPEETAPSMISESPRHDGGGETPDGTLADGAKAHTQNDEVDDSGTPDTSRIPPEESGEPAEIGGESPPEGEERVGEVLARRYRLTEFLGRGAMGEVFRAEHAFMKKTVALKILHTDVSDRGKIVERFRREAQAAANIDHPNVCVATDFGRTSESEFFLVMEFLEGETLKERVDREGAFEVDRALHIANQICSALVRAHEVGVVHRDLKPDNIMLVERGDESDFVKILDFGIARVRMGEETPELTKTGAVFGTPSYMSPEQAAGDPIDHRTDIYAIGSLLFEMLTGRRVFEAERGAQVMAMHVSNEPPVPSEVAPHGNAISDQLEDLILQLLAKDPDERPQTAEDLYRRLLQLDQVEAEPVYPGLPTGETERPEGTTPNAAPAAASDSDPSMVVSRFFASVSRWLERAGAGARWIALVGGLFGIVAILAVVVAGFSERGFATFGLERPEREREESVAAERAAFLEHEPVRRARRELDRGAVGSAIDRLRNLQASRDGESPHLAFLLGVALAEAERWEESLDAFQRSLRLEPGYIENRRLLKGVIGALDSEDRAVRKRVTEILAEHMERPSVRAVVGRAAWKGPSGAVRGGALSLLKDSGVFEELPKWTRRSIEMRHSQGCSEHRRNIDRLVELGDSRGLEILQIYDDFPRHGCGEHDRADCFGCIREDLAEAIERLRAVKEGDG